MPSGGHSSVGPAPDPNALRRDRDKAEWVHLPANGRQGKPPAWPLSAASPEEMAIWVEEWHRPQAVMWEANALKREVADYCRALAAAESPKGTVAQRTLVRQLRDDLGVSLPGLRRNRWLIDQAPSIRRAVRTNDTNRSAAKARFRVLQEGAA